MKLTPEIEKILPGAKDEVCLDQESHAKRQKVLHTAGYNSFFFGMNQVLTAISGVLITFGMTMVGVAAKDLISNGGAVSIATLAGETAGIIGFSTLGVAAGFVALATAAHQISSRVAHAVSYDQSEINAQHTAKYLAKALKQELEGIQAKPAEPVRITYANDGRADGKAWSQYLNERMAANQNQRS